MISAINNFNIRFSGKDENKKTEYSDDTLLKNTPITRLRIAEDKFSNALTIYPAKGITGNKNANFYEFLTMGMVPYLAGSLTLMAVFNAANKHFNHFAKHSASAVGNKLALGVLFYGIMKTVSKSFISKPIQMLTGVDIERPYAKVIYELPDDINDTDITSFEHHKIFESVDFPRWDLLYGDDYKTKNFRYDKFAKKLGLGANLNDSDQEVKPRVKEIAVKANLAKNISSYLWAACGVAYAFQQPWERYFSVMTPKFWQWDKFKKSLVTLKDSAIDSAKDFYKGQGNGISKNAGKILLGAAALSSVLGVANALHHKSTKVDMNNIIDKNGGYVKQ